MASYECLASSAYVFAWIHAKWVVSVFLLDASAGEELFKSY